MKISVMKQIYEPKNIILSVVGNIKKKGKTKKKGKEWEERKARKV